MSVLPVAQILCSAVRSMLAAGKDRIEVLGLIVGNLGQIAKSDTSISAHTAEILQTLLGQGYSREEIAAAARAAIDGTGLFNPDDPKNAAQAERLIQLVHEENALFFLTIIKAGGIAWSVPFINDGETVIDGHTVGGMAACLAYATQESARGNDVYLSTNSFVSPYYEEYGRKKGFRKSDNMHESCAFSADLDVKQGAYQTREEALVDLGRVIRGGRLPEPTVIVNSGRGVHAWWILDQVLPAALWKRSSVQFAATLKQHGLKFDQQCSSNPAGVLRLPGTANYKDGKVRPVTLDYVAEPAYCNAEAIFAVIGQPAGAGAQTAASVAGLLHKNFTAGVGDSAPPVDLDLVALECPMLADTLASGGLGHPEPQWRLDLLLAHFSTDPPGNAVRLAVGDPRFVLEETMEKLATIRKQHAESNFGWPQCATFSQFSPHCGSCPHHDEGKSPLNFGLPQHSPAAAVKPGLTGGWLAEQCRKYGVIAAGRYRGRLLARDIEAFTTRKARGVAFTIGIEGAPYDGYECRIAMLVEGVPNSIVRRDLGTLSIWADQLNAGAADDPLALIKSLGRTGEDQPLIFDIGVKEWEGRAELYLKGVARDG